MQHLNNATAYYGYNGVVDLRKWFNVLGGIIKKMFVQISETSIDNPHVLGNLLST